MYNDEEIREKLLKQDEKEAKEIALAIELFTDGSLNTFAKHTNVDIKNRLICYNIIELGKQLQGIGMLVCNMPKDIKKRQQQEKFIRKLDKNAMYTSKIKKNFQNSYRKISEEKSEEKESENPTNYASSNIMKNGKENIKLTGYLFYNTSKIAYKKIKSRLVENNIKKNAKTVQKEQMNKKLVKMKSDSKTVSNEKIIKKPNNKSETLGNTKKQLNDRIKNISKELGKKIIKRNKKHKFNACIKWRYDINNSYNNSYNCFNIWFCTRFFILK